MALSTIQNNSFADTAVHGFRNIIINGAMQVAQRGTSTTNVSSSGYYSCDRMQFVQSGRDQFEITVSQDSDSPDGFSNSWKMQTTTVETAIDSTEYVLFRTKIEGQDLQHLKYGTSNAQQLTLSFWVKSSIAATYAVYLYQPDDVRIIGSTYTINSASTWEYKQITFSGDVTGIIDNNNGEGLHVVCVLAAGSGMRTTDNTSWSAYASGKLAYGHTDTANTLLTTLNATWQITGVQLEIGSEATPFEHRPYADELQRCQRYFYKDSTSNHFLRSFNASSTGDWYEDYPLPVSMRATPTWTAQLGGDVSKVNAVSIFGKTNKSGYVIFTVNSTGQGYCSLNTVTADAEL